MAWVEELGGIGSNTDVSSSAKTTYCAKVATWNELTEKVESNDPSEKEYSKTTYDMTSTNINYQDFVSGYTMPFDYLWALLVVGEDKDFVLDLADLVYGSEIEITVHDNLTVNTNVNVTTYTKKVKTETEAKVTVNYGNESANEHTASKKDNWTDEDKYNYKTTYTTIMKTNTLDIALTKANVWIVEYTKKYKYEVPDNVVTKTSNNLKDIAYSNSPDSTSNEDSHGHASALLSQTKASYSGTYTKVSGKVDYVKEKKYNATVDRKESITNTTETKRYVASPANIREKTEKKPKNGEENFVTIFLNSENKKAKINILNVPTWLFEILETNKSTAEMVDLTKYLLYKATGKDYGKTEFDFSIYDPENFMILNAESGGTSGIEGVPGQIYDFLLQKGVPPVGAASVVANIENESSFDPKCVNSIGCSGLCQWYKGRLAALKDLAQKKGVNWTDVNVQLEYMWKELEGSYKSVKDVIMNAKAEKDLEYATWYWGRHYEVYFVGEYESTRKGKEQTERYQDAQKWYKKWQQSHTSGGANFDSTADIAKYKLNIHNGFIEYKQGDYSTTPPSYNATGESGTIKAKGCMPTSISIILSGMGIKDSSGKVYTPPSLISSGTIKQYTGGSSTYPNAKATFNKVGLKLGSQKSTRGNSQDILKSLQAKKPILVHCSTGYYTGGGHFMTLIDVKGSNVYLSNPGSRSKNGWVNIGTLISRNVDWYAVVSR